VLLVSMLLTMGCRDPDPPLDASLDTGPICQPPPGETFDVEGTSWVGPRINPQSEWLALIRNEAGSPVAVDVVDFCGEEIVSIATSDVVGTFVAWADERTVYYASSAGIMQVSLSGGGGTPTLLIADAQSFDVANGLVVFARDGQLHRYEVDSGTETSLMVAGTFPRFSPSGARVAFFDEEQVKVLTLGGTEVIDGPDLGPQDLQPFDWGVADTQLAIKAAGGLDAILLEESGFTRLRLADVGEVVDLDVSPNGEYASYRREGASGFTIHGIVPPEP